MFVSVITITITIIFVFIIHLFIFVPKHLDGGEDDFSVTNFGGPR